MTYQNPITCRIAERSFGEALDRVENRRLQLSVAIPVVEGDTDELVV